MIRSYHNETGRRRFNYNFKYDTEKEIKVGLEIELEFDSMENIAKISEELELKFGDCGNRFTIERDGSLSNGFELVTSPITYAPDRLHINHFLWIEEMFEFINNNYKMKTKGSGFHIHVDRLFFDDYWKESIGLIGFLFHKNRDEVFKFSNRKNIGSMNRWAKIADLETTINPHSIIALEQCYDRMLAHGKYSAVNLSNDSTIEFRIFGALRTFKDLIKHLHGIYNIVTYARNNMYEVVNPSYIFPTLSEILENSQQHYLIGEEIEIITNKEKVLVVDVKESKKSITLICRTRTGKTIKVDALTGEIALHKYLGKVFDVKYPRTINDFVINSNGNTQNPELCESPKNKDDSAKKENAFQKLIERYSEHLHKMSMEDFLNNKYRPDENFLTVCCDIVDNRISIYMSKDSFMLNPSLAFRIISTDFSFYDFRNDLNRLGLTAKDLFEYYSIKDEKKGDDSECIL